MEKDYFHQPSIIISPPELVFSSDEAHYFNEKNAVIDDGLFIKKAQDEIDPPINISNKLNYHHPLSKQLIDQKVQSAPILHHLAPPPPSSILIKHVNSSPAVPKHITLEEEERRPSVITFATEFYDALEEVDDNDEKKVIYDETKKQPHWRRPSLMSRISSAYTNKTAAITVDHIDLDECRYLHEGIVICAIVSRRKQQMELQPKYHHQTEFKKRPLKWKEYRAVITPSGYLELYNVCHCNNSNKWLLHKFCHKLQYRIDLHPSVNNKLFGKSFLINHKSSKNYYKLSLMSPIDFSWSLTSSHTIFYFQSNSINVSQHWYRSLYTALPVQSKLPLPKNVDLVVPALSSCIRLPLSEFITSEDENVDLRKVRDSALVLLHRNGIRPSHWSKKTVGLCWKLRKTSNNNDIESIHWALKPSDDEQHIAYLITPRLIEKTHEIQMRCWTEEDDTKAVLLSPPAPVQGYLTGQSSSSTFANKLHSRFFAKTMDQFIFFFEDKAAITKGTSSLLCFNLKSSINNKTSPRDSIVESSSPRDAVGIIDLSKITEITEEEPSFGDQSQQQEGDEEKDHSLLHLNDYSFLIMRQPVHDWSTRLTAIQKYYSHGTHNNSVLQCTDAYIKLSKGKYHAFERRFCVLTNNGDLCVFKSPKHAPYKKMDFSIPLKDDPGIFVYSGEECCNFITRLPLQWSSRIFDNGIVVENTKDNRPNQCCFVIHCKDKDYVFLMKSSQEKEAWVQSICSFL